MPTFVLAEDAGMPTYAIVLIIIACILLVAGGVFLGIFLYLKNFQKIAKNYRKAYEEYHNLLTADCHDMIMRVQTLGKANDYFRSVYDVRQKQYDDILNRRDKDMLGKLDAVDILIKEKKYQDYKNAIADCKQYIDSFEHAVCNFNTELTSILQDDNDIRNNAVVVKSKYRQIKEFYENHSNELKMLAKSFNKLLTYSETQFASFDDCINRADYPKAKELLSDLERLLDLTLAVMEKLPLLAVSVSTVLPGKVTELANEYQKMLDEDYVVQYLDIPQLVESINAELALLRKQLLHFGIEGVQQKIDSISASIIDMMAKFEEERNAKEKYQKDQNVLAESSFSIEKRYSKLINMMPEYSKTFVLDEKYISQMNNLKSDIEAIGLLKRSLDSCLDTEERKPYVTIIKTMSDMNGKIQKVSSIMTDYTEYLDSLKNDSSFVFNGLRDCYINLKKAQVAVREIGVDTYTNAIKNSFTDLYSQIETINKMVMTRPIDVKKALELYTPFKASVDGLKASVDNVKKAAELAEAKIVEGNAYRMDYRDCRDSLAEAEKCFNDADFDKAISITESTLSIYAGPKE